MTTLRYAEARLSKWQRLLEYQERELEALPGRIASTRESIAHWEGRVAELAVGEMEPEVVVEVTAVESSGPLTREDNRFAARYYRR